MTKENEELYVLAQRVKFNYQRKLITREQAEQALQPYVEAFNNKARELAKKYGVRAKLFNFTSFMREAVQYWL